MEFEFNAQYQPGFIGREAELKWLDDRLFRRSYSFSPILVTGMAGVGKTSLLNQWFSTRRVSYRPMWIDLSRYPDESIIDEIILQLRAPSEDHLFERGVTIVLDSADHWLSERLNSAINRIFNYKIVSAVVVISRQNINLRRADHIHLDALSHKNSDDLIQSFLNSNLTALEFTQAFDATQGNPFALKMLAELLRNSDFQRVMSSLKNEPIYQFPEEIILPEKEIIQITQPIILLQQNKLIEALKKQPTELRQIDSRAFEKLLADLLSDMGFEVKLTQATRDGGADILAYMDTAIGRTLCLVEAKHYRPDRKVSVELVRTLYGTLCDAQANSAMLVTSSSFTKDARDFQSKHQYQLSLKDYTDVVKWIINFGKKKP